MVHCLPHYHNLYAEDNTEVYRHIFESTLCTLYTETIAPFNPDRGGGVYHPRRYVVEVLPVKRVSLCRPPVRFRVRYCSLYLIGEGRFLRRGEPRQSDKGSSFEPET